MRTLIKYLYTLSMALLIASCDQNSLLVQTLTVTTSDPTVYFATPVIAKSDELVTLVGDGLSSDFKVMLADTVVPLESSSKTALTFRMPANLQSGLQTFRILKDDKTVTAVTISTHTDATVPFSSLPASFVCKGTHFTDDNGQDAIGEKFCTSDAAAESGKSLCSSTLRTYCIANEDFPAVDKIALASQPLFLKSLTLVGIEGSMVPCTALKSDCYLPIYSVIAQPFKAANMSVFLPEIIQQGQTLAGVAGTMLGSPAPCTNDGTANCLTSTTYPAVDLANLNSNKSKLLSTATIGGIQGTMALCGNNDSNCFLGSFDSVTQPMKAINYDSLNPSLIKSGTHISNITGTLAISQSDCSTDNQTNCLATALHPAVDAALVNASRALYDSAITVAGISGTLTACGADGAIACTTSSSFPSLDKSYLTSHVSSVSSSIAFAAGTGTLSNCAANASACLLPSYAAGSQNLKAINFDNITAGIIKIGSTIAGIAGSLAEAPGTCNSDGQDNCVTISAFPAAIKADVDASKAKFIKTLTLAGITGTMDVCTLENQIGCYTSTAFPAVDKSIISANISKIHDSLMIAGVAGSLSSCSASSQTACLAISAYPSVNKVQLDSNSSKLFDSVSLVGVTGTLVTCSANASSCYLPSYLVTTQPLKAIDFSAFNAASIKLGINIGGIVGTAAEAPADCGSNGATNCVTISTYPAMNVTTVNSNRAKIHSTLTLGGITGSLGSCAVSGDVSCLTTTALPSFDRLALVGSKDKVRSSLTISGIVGTLVDCAANASDCFLATYASVTQPLKAINFDLLNSGIILSGHSIGTVAGSLDAMPVDCTANAAVGCRAVSGMRAVDRVTAEANKARISDTINAGGVVGTLSSCGTDGATSCITSATFPAVNSSYVDSHKASIATTLSIGGIAGTLGNCAALDSNCYIPSYALTTQPLKAISYDSITAAVIKKSSVIAGVTGNYPSSLYPMATGDALSDLTSSTFNSQIVSATAFGWFNRNGTRLSHAGDADIIAANIKYGVNVFGVDGSYRVPVPWDVRIGTTVAPSVTGKLKVACRNLADTTLIDTLPGHTVSMNSTTEVFTSTVPHGFAAGDIVRVSSTAAGGTNSTTPYYVRFPTTYTFKLSTNNLDTNILNLTANTASTSVYRQGDGAASSSDTLEGYATAGVYPNGVPFASANRCDGVAPDDSSSNVWLDVTTGGCVSGAECRYKDQITNLEWSKLIGYHTWANSKIVCDQLNYDGKSNWRVPTINELLEGFVHGIATAANPNWTTAADFDSNGIRWWSATKRTDNATTGWRVEPRYGGIVRSDWMSFDILGTVCVRMEGDELL